MTDGFGSITWWGFTPCLDLQEKDIEVALDQLKVKDSSKETLNVLLVGAGDCRHILRTLSRAYSHPERKINFYVVECNLELYARDLLLLTIALEQQNRVGLQDKTELFLEIFGNSLVRQQSMEYVEKMSNEFIKMVTDFDYLEKKMPLFDMSQLKFKERDMLEGIFKFWRTPDPEKKIFDIELSWDLRLRKYLGKRYDAIPNVFDWDFNMKLVDKGAGIINHRIYSTWRHKGIAYDLREATYDVPNKTLASGMVFKVEGERLARRGYWGDIIVSPFIQFGIECEEKSFFKKSNNMYTQSSQHVAEYNMLSVFYELANREKYVAPEKEETTTQDETKKGPTLTEITEEDEETDETTEQPEKVEETDQSRNTQNPLDKEYEPLPVDFAKVYLLPLNCLPDLHKKSKYHKLFNMAYFSNSMVHLLKKDLCETFQDNATIILETAKFMLELQDDQIKAYGDKVLGIAKDVGCKAAGSPDVHKDNFIKFIYNRS